MASTSRKAPATSKAADHRDPQPAVTPFPEVAMHELARRKGTFGESHLRAICDAAGVTMVETTAGRDSNSIDSTIQFPEGDARVQVKTTSQFKPHGRSASWPLHPAWVKRWDVAMIPTYFVLVMVPDDPDRWHREAEAFWCRITPGELYKRIHVPKSQRVTAATLVEWRDDVVGVQTAGFPEWLRRRRDTVGVWFGAFAARGLRFINPTAEVASSLLLFIGGAGVTSAPRSIAGPPEPRAPATIEARSPRSPEGYPSVASAVPGARRTPPADVATPAISNDMTPPPPIRTPQPWKRDAVGTYDTDCAVPRWSSPQSGTMSCTLEGYADQCTTPGSGSAVPTRCKVDISGVRLDVAVTRVAPSVAVFSCATGQYPVSQYNDDGRLVSAHEFAIDVPTDRDRRPYFYQSRVSIFKGSGATGKVHITVERYVEDLPANRSRFLLASTLDAIFNISLPCASGRSASSLLNVSIAWSPT